jgi:hypothetical protein
VNRATGTNPEKVAEEGRYTGKGIKVGVIDVSKSITEDLEEY